MFIANKTVYYNEKTNQVENYLCHELSKNKLFSEFDFWMELLKERVELIAEVEINQEMKKRKDSIGKEDSTIINSAIGKFGKFFVKTPLTARGFLCMISERHFGRKGAVCDDAGDCA